MTDPHPRQNFWTTVPGILTGVAALITAITGLIVVLSRNDSSGSPPADGGRTAAAVKAAREPAAPPTPATAGDAPLARATRAEALVTITARNGQTTTVFAGSFQHRQTSRQLYLQSGQQVPFDRIKSIEFTRHEPDRALVTITLIDGGVHEDAVNAGLYPYGFSGTNALGGFEISVADLARVTFDR